MSIARKIITGDAGGGQEYQEFDATIVVIGGGGAGGTGSNSNVAGGGGAGRFVVGAVTLNTHETYRIVCGYGGLRGTNTSHTGESTTFTAINEGFEAIAVGGGGGRPSEPTGGSGGGGDLYSPFGDEDAGDSKVDAGLGVVTLNTGSKGGFGEGSAGVLTYSNSGGGGGAAGKGGDWRVDQGGRGGNGYPLTITGVYLNYAGGGGGGAYTGPGGLPVMPDAGVGGSLTIAATDATRGSGGGGGSGGGSAPRTAGKGGNGIVIIRSVREALSTEGEVTLYRDADDYIYEFTTNGSIEFVSI